MIREFHCVQDCSDCCIYRQYFPSVDYGKIGVLLLPEEKEEIENLAEINNLKINVLPRLGIGFNRKANGPCHIIAYQLMGKINGDYCPFLDTESKNRSPHGGLNCQIYDVRPLSCRAYPVIKEHAKNVEIDSNCKFSCQNSIWINKNLLENELKAIKKISNDFDEYENQRIWRYATHIGEEPFMKLLLPQGWYLQKE